MASAQATFLGIPIELRSQIYEHLMPHTFTRTKRLLNRHGAARTSYTNVLLACRKVHDEFKSVLHIHLMNTDRIEIAIKNFDFRSINYFVRLCSPELAARIRASQPPVMVAKLHFCKHFKEHLRAGTEPDYHSTNLGFWLRDRDMSRSDRGQDPVPVRYELGNIRVMTQGSLFFYVQVFRNSMYAKVPNIYVKELHPHPDGSAIATTLQPWLDEVNRLPLGADGATYDDVFDTSASDEDDDEVSERARIWLNCPIWFQPRPSDDDEPKLESMSDSD